MTPQLSGTALERFARRAYRFARAAGHTAVGSNRRARARLDGSRAAILMYHRILPEVSPGGAVEPGMVVRPETFARHLDWLESAFRVLPLSEIAERLGSEQSLPSGACAITFDDGWRDNLEHALPELERRALPATLFVVTDRVGTGGAFWPDELYRRLNAVSDPERAALFSELGVELRADPVQVLLGRLKTLTPADRERVLATVRSRTPEAPDGARELLNWDEIDRMGQRVEIESHGATHAILTGLGEEAIRDELVRSRRALLERGHGNADLLAYPSGGFDPRVQRLAREAGYRAAVTTEQRTAVLGCDLMDVPRLALHDDVSRTQIEFLHRIPGFA